MKWNFKDIQNQINEEAQGLTDVKVLEAFRIKYLGKKGLVAEVYASLGSLSKEEKPLVGKGANDLRQQVTEVVAQKKKDIHQQSQSEEVTGFDSTIPGIARPQGHSHILVQTMDEICGIFEKLGFVIQEGPEIETEFNNFDALNIQEDHPSRDGFDTFYVDQKDVTHKKDRNFLLRSQTSPVQIRVMSQNKPPLAVIAPGKVYRPDAVDASHSFMFHQIEGLLVDHDVKFSDLKGTILAFCKKFFGPDIKTRFRPHFFPFTEPSAEVDISCYICGGSGCSVCGRNGWLEIMGCGMVHPRVFEAVQYEKDTYSGFAFGLGVERIAMLRHGIHDIRIFYENDQRFLKQF